MAGAFRAKLRDGRRKGREGMRSVSCLSAPKDVELDVGRREFRSRLQEGQPRLAAIAIGPIASAYCIAIPTY